MDWMGKLSDAKKCIPISQLVIPGSHDSGCYYLDINGPLEPGQPPIFSVFKQAVYNWSITHDKDFEQQLKMGIRYFDLRLAPHPATNSLHIVHGLYGNDIGPCMHEIKTFLAEHSSEVVILNFARVENCKSENYEVLIQQIHSCFGNMLADEQSTLDNTTLHNLTASGKQVIALYCKQATKKFLWPHKFINNPWPNVQSTPDLLTRLKQDLPQRNPRILFVSQGVLTPDTGSIVKNLFTTLKDWEMKNEVKENVLQWARQSPHRNLLNIVIVDFVDEKFASEIISFNE